MAVQRIYVEKRPEHAVEAKGLLAEFRGLLGAKGLTGLRILNRYDVEGMAPEQFREAVPVVFSEPQLDDVHTAIPEGSFTVFATEYLPGQFDQRAASAAECVGLLFGGERPAVATARVFLLSGSVSAAELAAIKKYVINPVEAREASLEEKKTLAAEYPAPDHVATLTGFIGLDKPALAAMVQQYGLAMDADDVAFCQAYFRKEGRDPTITELRMIDTYWSDHCRHTTFGTILDEVVPGSETLEKAYARYLAMRKEVYAGGREKPICLMDMGTMGGRYLKKRGALKGLDESDEINACSVKISVDNNGKQEPWLLLFKNETHNHPTEIEPFGGAATCIGGAIRDPLANRGYVFGAMRVTGAADPLKPVSETMPGKLPQRKLVQTAAAGYSSYGNQIGLATGVVDEIYHPGYAAKRMEIGAVLGAVPEENVRREEPAPGDVVILLGGRTGRDGCGGATGSSKAHKLESLETCGAEVQKGNAPIERKLQRLFRTKEATLMIKRCNDFGAGGVSVAIGELADGLSIDLDAVPKKYDGLDGTELAISESQERMAVVVETKDADAFIAAASKENLEATRVALVTAEPRLVMRWKGRVVCDIAREFLNSNGAEKHARAVLAAPQLAKAQVAGATFSEKMHSLVASLNVCSKKGLAERFDSTIGAGTVLMPFGGRRQLTPIQAMVDKLPVLHGETRTCAGMAWGYNPFISEKSPYHGAYLAVAESISKLVATGLCAENAYLTFQEYFQRLGADAARWGQPVAALLGALDAQADFGVAAIGGKDSMSGTFENIDVPPTLVSFAVAAGETQDIVSPEFKLPGSKVVLLRPAMADALRPEAESLKAVWAQVQALMREGRVLAAYTPGMGGVAEALFKMCAGNSLGFRLAPGVDADSLFDYAYGSFVLELAGDASVGTLLGETTNAGALEAAGETVSMEELLQAWEGKLEPIFPYHAPARQEEVPCVVYKAETRVAPKVGAARPRVLIPVFPGTNCEYDSARAMERAGAQPDVFVINNLTPAHVAESAKELAKRIGESQMVFLPGGFSGGDEPEGSAKFIAAFFRNPAITEAVHALLKQRDGLMLGICNGFQALVKLGLVPFGEIVKTDASCPTLTFNEIGRHQSMLVRTRVASNKSPWLQFSQPGDVHTIAVSHGEGRFVASGEVLAKLRENGQIATQYVDLAGAPTLDMRYNPNGSVWAIEGITSPDGRVLGKMGHSERFGNDLYKNVDGNKDQRLFEGGVAYFAL